jgi:hypothetical protein
MEKSNETPQPHRMEIVLRFNLLEGEFSLTGCDQNPVVALGMLDYALARVRRALSTNDILHDAQNARTIVLPRGPLA